MDKLWHCRLIRKVKILNINVSLLFNKIEPASGSRGGTKVGGTGELAPHYVPVYGGYRGTLLFYCILVFYALYYCEIIHEKHTLSIYEMSCLWKVLSIKCSIYGMSHLWISFFLWNILSIKCSIYKMSTLLNVHLWNVFLWNVSISYCTKSNCSELTNCTFFYSTLTYFTILNVYLSVYSTLTYFTI